MSHPFVSFLKPVLDFVDSGKFFKKPFSFLYGFIAIYNFLLPFYFFYNGIVEGFFKLEFKPQLAFYLILFVSIAFGWFGFMLWWNRISSLEAVTSENSEFVATPVLSHYVQTIGEWLGLTMVLCGFFIPLITHFLVKWEFMIARFVPWPFSFFIGYDWYYCFIFPFGGFFTVLFFRFFSEQVKAIATIANNTKK